MINAFMLLTSKKVAQLRWTRDRSRVDWEEFLRCQVRANETYSEANRQFSVMDVSVMNMDVSDMTTQSSHM